MNNMLQENILFVLTFFPEITLGDFLGNDTDELIQFLVNTTGIPVNTSQALIQSRINVSLSSYFLFLYYLNKKNKHFLNIYGVNEFNTHQLYCYYYFSFLSV